jgi:hypothetical protein
MQKVKLLNSTNSTNLYQSNQLQNSEFSDLNKLPIINVMIEGIETSCLIDTGSTFSILSKQFYQESKMPIRLNTCPIILNAANGSPIEYLGKASFKLQLGSCDIAADFLVADVHCNILGYNFLKDNELTFSYKNRKMHIIIGKQNINECSEISCNVFYNSNINYQIDSEGINDSFNPLLSSNDYPSEITVNDMMFSNEINGNDIESYEEEMPLSTLIAEEIPEPFNHNTGENFIPNNQAHDFMLDIPNTGFTEEFVPKEITTVVLPNTGVKEATG